MRRCPDRRGGQRGEVQRVRLPLPLSRHHHLLLSRPCPEVHCEERGHRRFGEGGGGGRRGDRGRDSQTGDGGLGPEGDGGGNKVLLPVAPRPDGVGECGVNAGHQDQAYPLAFGQAVQVSRRNLEENVLLMIRPFTQSY